MCRHRVWQDVGVERRLEVGSTYNLPDVVATALIATGAAVHARATEPQRETSMEPPERKPIAPPERKADRAPKGAEP